MKIIFCIHTPAHVHLFRNIIRSLMVKGHVVNILARDYGPTLTLLDKYGFHYDVYIRQSKRLKSLKSFQIFPYVYNEYRLSKRLKPNLIVGIGPDEPLFAVLLGKPCVLFNDSEPMPFQHLINKTFASAIVTPSCFRKDLGKKQIRFAGYKELAYLHPNYFEPDPEIYRELGISTWEKYAILRFNVFDAVHDIGRHGFSTSDQFRLVKEIGKYARVFISPEGSLPKELEKYRLPISYDRIHHALYYAQMLVSDTGTMTTESAILGTPGIMCLSNAEQFGNFVELEHKYDLMYSFQEPEMAVQKALELIQRPNLKAEWAKKRQILLNDKIDVTQFMIDFIENYPGSFEKYKQQSMREK